MYPRIEINLKNIIENINIVNSLCLKSNIHFSLVTKLFSGNYKMIKALYDNGVTCICESKIADIIICKDIPIEKWLIRMPMLSEVKNVVKYCDVSFNTELTTILAINKEAQKQNKIHRVILMYELGDLREGCYREELFLIAKECLKLKNIKLYGIGSNLSCYGGIIPTEENMNELSELVIDLEKELNYSLPIVSGGNSSSFNMLRNGKLPSNINNLRLGESIFLGNVPCFEIPIDELNKNNFVLKAEIIELKEKPSIPKGISYVNSVGEKPCFVDLGIRKRAILGIGKQDVTLDRLIPKDTKIKILGGSSDHIILDVTDSKKTYKVGDIVEFDLTYLGILNLMTSKYIKRKIVK